jgi:hypothetical protein
MASLKEWRVTTKTMRMDMSELESSIGGWRLRVERQQ